jgi:hypothetical protein
MTQKDLSSIAKKLSPWMSFHGWIYVITGIFTCLSIIGVFFGLPLILAGSSLLSSADKFNSFSKGDDFAIEEALEKQLIFFMITAIMYFIFFVLPFILFLSLLLGIIFNADFHHSMEPFIDNLPKSLPYDLRHAKEV